MSHEKGSPTSGAHTAELTSTAWTGAWWRRPVLLVLPRAEPGGGMPGAAAAHAFSRVPAGYAGLYLQLLHRARPGGACPWAYRS